MSSTPASGVGLYAYAANCLLYEGDSQPPEIAVGTRIEQRISSPAEAWRHTYAVLYLADIGCDDALLFSDSADAFEQLELARRDARWFRRRSAVRAGRDPQEVAEVWECAVAIADRAHRMMAAAEAVGPNAVAARRRLARSMRFEADMTLLAPLLGDDWARNRLAEHLRTFDEPDAA